MGCGASMEAGPPPTARPYVKEALGLPGKPQDYEIAGLAGEGAMARVYLVSVRL